MISLNHPMGYVNGYTPEEIGRACMHVVNSLAGCSPGMRPVVIPILFAMLCRTYKVTPQTAWETANNVIDESLNGAQEIKAAALWIRNQT